MTEQIITIHTFNPSLKCQPDHFVADADQNIFVIGSSEDGIWVDLNQKREEDLDKMFKVSLILDVIIDSESREFYFICNKY